MKIIIHFLNSIKKLLNFLKTGFAKITMGLGSILIWGVNFNTGNILLLFINLL
jgi:hypothetical protein